MGEWCISYLIKLRLDILRHSTILIYPESNIIIHGRDMYIYYNNLVSECYALMCGCNYHLTLTYSNLDSAKYDELYDYSWLPTVTQYISVHLIFHQSWIRRIEKDMDNSGEPRINWKIKLYSGLFFQSPGLNWWRYVE